MQSLRPEVALRLFDAGGVGALMATDYQGIARYNRERYGWDIERVGKMLMADRYDDRTHFIFELLQNAEDALARCKYDPRSRAVSFDLRKDCLRVSHFGIPFTEQDVRGVCGISEGTKSGDPTAIGRFGIGFKAVYAITDSPEVHSGDEHFVVEKFVWPRGVEPAPTRPGETLFVFPFRQTDETAFDDIVAGLRRIGPRTLLFLHQIDEITWSAEGGQRGLYARSQPESVGHGARKVVLTGQEEGVAETCETWLVFSRAVKTDGGVPAGDVEVAFKLKRDEATGKESVERLADSTLVVFFPTIVPTHLGFLIQGPYRTTPSRDNVPFQDSWNRHLVEETARLLVEALRGLRDLGLLDVEAVRCMPTNSSVFSEDSMFRRLFIAVRDALHGERLLPKHGGGHVAARRAFLARGQPLRKLVDSSQLRDLFQVEGTPAWLSEEITENRTPDLHEYLTHELEIREVNPDSFVRKLTRPFLEKQCDSWIRDLYEFLANMTTWTSPQQLERTPIIRLEDGTHVTATANGRPQAFLPGPVPTGFPTVRRAVCSSDASMKFLRDLGLKEPDPVDDVILNVLPRYDEEGVCVEYGAYAADIARIQAVYNTDSESQRKKLCKELRQSYFVRAIDAGDGAKRFCKPGEVYLATDRLKELFSGVPGVFLVDDSCKCLRGEAIRRLLEECGAARCLRPLEIRGDLTDDELRELRKKAGYEQTSGYNDRVVSHTLHGLDELLDTLPRLPADQQVRRAELLWEELVQLEERWGKAIFEGRYTWTHYGPHKAEFAARFVRQLNSTAWIPDGRGGLQQPEFVAFETLGWKPDPFLQSKIRFKPPAVDILAREVGVEPEVIHILKKLGLTTAERLKARVGATDESEVTEEVPPASELTPAEAVRNILGEQAEPIAPVGSRSDEFVPVSPGGGGGRIGSQHPHNGISRARSPGRTCGRTFISYVAVHPEEEDQDPDGLEYRQRLELEERAIKLILGQESDLVRAEDNNPGFDLVEPGPDGAPVRWVEVKAMTGDLQDRPVGLSRAQFETAQRQGSAYWLYVVERAGSDSARIVRIQDPAGKARTFTFDRGWLRWTISLPAGPVLTLHAATEKPIDY